MPNRSALAAASASSCAARSRVAGSSARSEHQRKFMLRVGKPRPGLQTLVQIERRFEVLFGCRPIAHGAG